MDCAADWIRPFRFHRALLVGSSLLFVKCIIAADHRNRLISVGTARP